MSNRQVSKIDVSLTGDRGSNPSLGQAAALAQAEPAGDLVLRLWRVEALLPAG